MYRKGQWGKSHYHIFENVKVILLSQLMLPAVHMAAAALIVLRATRCDAPHLLPICSWTGQARMSLGCTTITRKMKPSRRASRSSPRCAGQAFLAWAASTMGCLRGCTSLDQGMLTVDLIADVPQGPAGTRQVYWRVLHSGARWCRESADNVSTGRYTMSA